MIHPFTSFIFNSYGSSFKISSLVVILIHSLFHPTGGSWKTFSVELLIFFFPEFQALIITEVHLNHCKDSPCVFNFSFFSFLLFTGVLHGGSTCWFIKDLISSWSVHQDSFLRNSSFLHIVIRSAISFYHIIGDGIMSFLIIWVHVPWFTCC